LPRNYRFFPLVPPRPFILFVFFSFVRFNHVFFLEVKALLYRRTSFFFFAFSVSLPLPAPPLFTPLTYHGRPLPPLFTSGTVFPVFFCFFILTFLFFFFFFKPFTGHRMRLPPPYDQPFSSVSGVSVPFTCCFWHPSRPPVQTSWTCLSSLVTFFLNFPTTLGFTRVLFPLFLERHTQCHQLNCHNCPLLLAFHTQT